MLMFFTSVGLLILGYFLYGRLVDRLFGSDPARKTPAETLEDGVDYVKLPPWKIFLIQLLRHRAIRLEMVRRLASMRRPVRIHTQEKTPVMAG